MASSLLIILSSPQHEPWALEVAGVLGSDAPLIVVGSPLDAARKLTELALSPAQIVMDIGNRNADVLYEIDALAEHCDANTRVVALGSTNDIGLYRELVLRGVVDYLPMPSPARDIYEILHRTRPVPRNAGTSNASAASGRSGRVIACIAAGSGDGASMVALNTAYTISNAAPGSTVLIDMDYQFGMIAKQIDLQAAFGIRELFDNPDRIVDTTLLRRMVAKYGTLDVISAPADLRFLPNLDAATVRNLLTVLRENYDTIIIDLPHVWLPWVATVIQEADKVVMVAQLWLKSVAHAARIMKIWREMGLSADKISVVINRAGAKFKEAVEEDDFERVCATTIRHRLANDIRTIGAAEAQAKTVMELPPSELSQGLDHLARTLVGLSHNDNGRSNTATSGSLLGLFKKRS